MPRFSFIPRLILGDGDFRESSAASVALERVSIIGRKDSVSPLGLITCTHSHLCLTGASDYLR